MIMGEESVFTAQCRVLWISISTLVNVHVNMAVYRITCRIFYLSTLKLHILPINTCLLHKLSAKYWRESWESSHGCQREKCDCDIKSASQQWKLIGEWQGNNRPGKEDTAKRTKTVPTNKHLDTMRKFNLERVQCSLTPHVPR